MSRWSLFCLSVPLILAGAGCIRTYNDQDVRAAEAAIQSGDEQQLKRLLAAHHDLANADDRGLHLLTQALAANNPRILPLLLDNGASPNVVDEDDGSDWRASAPLILAAGAGNLRAVKLLLDHGADPNLRDKYEQVAIGAAVQQDQVEAARLLLDRGADVRLWTTEYPMAGDGILRIVRSAAMIELLVAHGADVNAGWALDNAALAGDLERMKVLIAHGANLEGRGTAGETPLFCAAEGGRTSAVKLLIGHGANFAAPDNLGRSPLWVALANGHLETAQALVEHGQQLNASDSTLLWVTAGNGHEESVEYLLDHGFSVNGRSAWGESPLHAAAKAGHLSVISLLLDHGANPNARDDYGQSPLHLADREGHLDAVKLLIARGAVPQAADSVEPSSTTRKATSPASRITSDD